MRKFLPWIIVAVVLFAGYSYFKGINNTAVTLGNDVKESWANVQTSYQRRNDLIGNLVKTVEGAAEYEKGTLEAVIKARSSATNITIDPDKVTPEQLAEYNKVQGGLGGALKSLLATVEAYPTLQANQNFLKLQDELASTENQILTARNRFNETVKPYNNHVETFPNSIITKFMGYTSKPYFEAVAGADKAPEVEFNLNKDKK
jgi:LemA protein